MQYHKYGYSQQELDDVEIICFDKNIYLQLTLHIRVIYWCHLYLNHHIGSRFENITWKLFYRKVLVSQADLSIKTCSKCQQFKNRKTIYGHLPSKIIAALKLWNSVHIDPIVPIYKSIRQKKPCGAIFGKYVRITCMEIIDPATGWFKISKAPCFDLNEAARQNGEYIDKYYARLSYVFNNTWLSSYPCPHKVVFDNGYKFKR